MPRPRAIAFGVLTAALTLPWTADAQPELTVGGNTEVVGDGRTALPIVIAGSPAPADNELPDAPELPWVSCDGAARLPAQDKVAPAILAPAVSEPRELSCTARHRGRERSFTVRVQPPGEGLYATADPPMAAAMGPAIELAAFAMPGGVAPADEVRASVSSGQLSATGAGRFTIALPDNRAPRVIAVALTDGTRAGAAFVPVVGATKLPIETTRRAKVNVRLGGQWFGPITAKRKRVTVPIEVPPGVQQAVARATDRLGNARETRVDLRTPDAPRLAAVAPVDELYSGQTTRIAIALATSRGEPADDRRRLQAEAVLGSLSTPAYQGPGLWVADYTAPVEPGRETISIRVADDEGAGVAEVAITVRPGAPDNTQLPGFRPPRPPSAHSLELAVMARAGWVDNVGDLSRPRAGVGLLLRRSVGPIELGLSTGVEFMSFSDSQSLILGTEMQQLDRSVQALAVPVELRARIGFAGRFGASLTAGVMPVRVAITLAPDFQSPDEYAQLVFGQRAQLAVDTELAFGRVWLGLGLGRAPLPPGPLTGHLERLTVTAGYEMRLLDLGL